MSGKSLVGLLTGAVDRVRDDHEAVGFEVWRKRGIVANGFKLVSSGKPNQIVDWELFNMQTATNQRW